jgi:hypothetical protein
MEHSHQQKQQCIGQNTPERYNTVRDKTSPCCRHLEYLAMLIVEDPTATEM